jgi:hypothetical protein
MSTYCTARERLYRNQYSIAPSWAQHVAGFCPFDVVDHKREH